MPQEPINPIRLLIVDDDPEFAELLVRRMHLAGLEAVAAVSGDEALSAMQDHGPDVAVLDLKTSGPVGRGLLRRMKTLDPRLEVIVLFGRAGAGEAIGALQTGAFEVLFKPVDIEALAARIREAAERRTVLAEEDSAKS